MEELQIGRIVHYVLSQSDVDDIRHTRRIRGIIANPVSVGQHVSAIVVAIWPDEFGLSLDGINAKCFLDGNDEYWVTSRQYDEFMSNGTWHWPERE